MVTLFITYTTCLARKTDVYHAIKRMFLLTRLRKEEHNRMLRSVTYNAFDTMVNATIREENNHSFEELCACP